MKTQKFPAKTVTISLLIACITVFLLMPRWASAKNTNGQVIDNLLAQITNMGSYSYSARAIDTAIPLPLVENFGRTSSQSQYNIDADVNLADALTELSLTAENGNLVGGLSALYLKIEDGVVYTRPTADSEWAVSEEMDSTQTSANRPEHFLQAADNIQQIRTEAVGEETWQVYNFDVNSVRYAEMMRDMIQAELYEAGKIPEDMGIGLSDYYLDMQGNGEFWLDEEGVLRRQTIHVIYPAIPGSLDYHELEMTADYTNWVAADQVHLPAAPLQISSIDTALVVPALKNVTLNVGVILLTAFFALGLARAHSRRSYAVFAIVMVLLFAVQPVLETVVYAATTERHETIIEELTASDSADTEEIEQIRQQVEQDAVNSFNAEISPIDRAAIANHIGGLATSMYSGQQSAPLLAVSNTDTDGDGLEDHVEVNQLGLNPNNPDTDGDLISDGNEVNGFTLNGTKFYLNPLSMDSNGDGIADTMECIELINIDANGKITTNNGGANATCRDTDSDGTPDYADDDNDNDLVNDWQDTALVHRIGDVTNGLPNKELGLNIKGMTGGNKPLRVTVNFRPTDPNQLWYDRNFLDWPDNDLRGQYMRVYKTNNDLQLVPMLQLNLPKEEALSLPTVPNAQPVVPTGSGDLTNANSKLFTWLDKSLIDFYSMTISWVLVGSTPQLQILVPATLRNDVRTGAPSYFSSMIMYRPNGQDLFSSGSHQMKLAWVVMLDHDRCVVPDGKKFKDYCLKDDGSADTSGGKWVTQNNAPAHIYYENFYVTSLLVEEDLQAQAHIIYEQPDATARMTDQLMLFGYQVEQMVGREGKTVQETFTALTGQLGSANRLQLQSNDSNGKPLQNPDVINLGSYLATAVNPQLLTTAFGSYQNRVHSLMSVIQTDQRATLGKGANLQASTLTVDLSSAKVKTGTAVGIGHFKYKAPTTASSLTWEPLSAQQAWDGGLGQLALTTFNNLPAAQRAGMRSLEYQSAAAASHRIFANGLISTKNLNSSRFGAKILEIAKQSSALTVGAILPLLVRDADIKATGSQRLALVTNRASSSAKSNDMNKLAAGISQLAATSDLITASMDNTEPYGTMDVLLYWGIDVIGASIDTADAVPAAISDAPDLLKGGSIFDDPSPLGGSAFKFASILAAVVAYILIVITIIQLFTAKTDLERKRNFAQNVGLFVSVVGVMVLSIIISTGIGAVILAIIGAIDAVLGLVCGIINGATDDNIEDTDWVRRLCGGVGGLIKEAVAFIVYNADPTVDMTASNRLNLGKPTTALIQNNNLFGMSAGNQMKFTLPVSTLMVGSKDNAGNGIGKLSTTELLRIIREKNFFNYDLITTANAPKDDNLATKGVVPSSAIVNISPNNAQRFHEIYVSSGVPFVKGPLAGKFQLDVARQETTVNEVVTLQAGVNWQPTLWLREYSMVSMVECGIIEAGCNDTFAEIDEFDVDPADKKAKFVDIDIKDLLQYDVFPATLAEFYTLRPAVDGTNRYRLAWDINNFPLLSDADGDGLITDGTRNVDPDDSKADTDGDTLSDKLEMSRTDLDPTKADTDGDGLNDAAELRYGTKPDQADTDNDGLSDKAEIDGWAFIWVDAANQNHTTWVTSNPFVQDTDGDQILDGAEKTYGFHPRVASAFNVLSMQTVIDDNDGYLLPGQTVPFVSTVKNELQNRTAYGLLEAALSGVTSSNSVPTPFEINGQQSQQINGNFTIDATSPTGVVDVRVRAGANIVEKGTTFANQLLGVGNIPKPQLLINFEQGYGGGITDASGNGATVTCDSATCPTIDRTIGNRAYLNRKQWYRVNSSALNFAQPAFTLSTIIDYKPVYGASNHKEATTMVVFGNDYYATDTRNPFELILVDTLSDQVAKPRLTFNSCRVDFINTTIAANRRELLTISYNGTEFLAYKNGVLSERIAASGTCLNQTPNVNQSFSIGRGSNGDSTKPAEGSRVQARSVYVLHSGFTAVEGTAAEPFLLYQNSELSSQNQVVWAETNVDEDTSWWGVDSWTEAMGYPKESKWLPLPWRGTATFVLCEDDGEGTFPNVSAPYANCDTNNTGNDTLGTVSTSITDIGYKSKHVGSGNTPDGEWRYDIFTTNNFFNGHLDDIAFYNSTLSAEQISKLASGWAATFHLDEASGRSSFRNSGVINSSLICKQSATPLTENQCPLSGVLGAAGQGVYFDGASGRDIRADNMRDILSESFVVSMWVKPERGMSQVSNLFGYGSFAIRMRHNTSNDKAEIQVGSHSEYLPYDKWTRVSYAIRKESSRYFGYFMTLEAGKPLSNATTYLLDIASSGSALPSGNVPVPVKFGATGYKGYMDEISIRPISASSSQAQLLTEVTADLKHQLAFNLPFDETVGSTTFVDTVNPHSSLSCYGPCPKAGAKGQVREARQFSGSEAVRIQLSQRHLNSTEGFSISGWFKPAGAAASQQNLVSIGSSPGAPRAYLMGSNLLLDCSRDNTLATVPVPSNTWTHFTLVMQPNNGAVHAYVNGRLVGTGTTANGCSGNAVDLEYWFFGYKFSGMLDEFSGYYHALEDEDVLSLYEYQRTWFDVSNTQQFTVDADKPTVAILGNNVIGTGTTTFAISARDETTPIASVEYWDGSAWKAATQGAGIDPSLWAFNWTVATGATGTITLQARATDRAGNSQIVTRQLTIVTAAPQLTLTTTGTPTAVKDVININGTIVNSVALGTVDITAFGEDGVRLGLPTRATVNEAGTTWSASIPIMGSYSGKVTFRYRVTNTLGQEREDALVGNRTFDNLPAFAGTSLDGLSVGGPSAALSGQATDIPFPSKPLIYFNFNETPKDVTVGGTAMKKWFPLTHNQYAAYGVGSVSTLNNALRVNAQGKITLADATSRNRMLVIPPEDVTIMFDVTPDSVATAKQHLLSEANSYGILLKNDQLILEVGESSSRVEVPLGVAVQAGQAKHLAVRIQRLSSTQQKVTVFVNGVVTGTPVTLSGNTLIKNSMVLPSIGNDGGTDFVGTLDNLAVFDDVLTATEIYNIAKQNGQTVTKVEVGLRHDSERSSETPLDWQNTTLATSGQTARWSYTLPINLEGVYHLSLRVTDSTGNQTTYPAIWTGVVDTKVPQIALSGTAANATCLMTDFSLATTTFACAQHSNSSGATQGNFSADWYTKLYRGSTPPTRLYTLQQTTAVFDATNNRAAACDQFGNCQACTATNDAEIANPSCSPFALNRRAANALTVEDPLPEDADRFAGFSMMVSYQQPPAHPNWTPPAANVPTWVEIEAYDVITDSVLNDFYQHSSSYTETVGLIEWTAALSATNYHVGWTTNSTATVGELSVYANVVSHTQVLTQNERYYAHVQVEDGDGNVLTEARGPFFVDDLAPTSLLQWESVEDGEPTRFWETVNSRTDLTCYLVGEDKRPLYQLDPVSPRATSQELYATWDDNYLALTYSGVDWNSDGDLHLYFDTQPGGALTAYNPYTTTQNAYAMVTMPSSPTSLSTTDTPLDRMAADYAVIVEDSNTLTLLGWNGTDWVVLDNSAVLFEQQTATETLIWLPLSTLGETASTLEIWMTAFATEEDGMKLWSAMPASNPLNSPILYPEAEPGDVDLDSRLVQLQQAILLTTEPDDIFDIDYCTNSIQFQESEIEMTIYADPSGEVYEPLLYEGIRGLIPSDIEPLLRNACGATPSADSRVCNLVNLWDSDYYGEEEDIGPYGLLPASVGPNQTVTYTLGIANYSGREATIVPQVNASSGLTIDASSVNGITRTIAAFDQISMTVVGQTTAVVTDSVYIELAAVENTGSEEQGLYLDYELYSAYMDHYIDSTGPISATIDGFYSIGLGDQLVSGIIIDQSDIAEVTLYTSLGTSATCTDVLRIGTFESDFLCSVEIPTNTADGTLVDVSITARDVYGYNSAHHQTGNPILDTWTFEVDALSPTVEWLDNDGYPQIPDGSAILTNTIDIWGAVIDNSEVGAVEICDTVNDVTSCTYIDPYVYDENSESVRANSSITEDVAFWEHVVPELPEQFDTHELAITGIDAVENRSEALTITLLIDTRPPTITVTTVPSNSIEYSEENPLIIGGTVTDDADVVYMDIEIGRPDETTVYEEIMFANGMWSYSSAGGEGFNIGGEYSINVAAWDSVDNMAFTDSYTVTLAKPADVFIYPPTITGTLPITPEFNVPLSYTLTIEDDDFSLGDEMRLVETFLPDGMTATLVTTNTIQVSGQIESLPDADSVTFFIQVEDLAGNQAIITWLPDDGLTQIFLPIVVKN